MQAYLAPTFLFLLVVALVAQHGNADSLTLLKPNATDKPHVGVVFIQGTQIVTKAYIPLMEKLQNTAAPYFSVFASVPAFVLSIPEPAQIGSCVSSAKKAMYAAGLDKDAPIVVMGHSLGGIMGQDYVFSHKDEVSALVLMGAGLARKYRNGTASYTYPVPTLTLDGTLDGLYRVTRQAESYYHQILHAKDPQSAVEMFPVVVYEGVTHMQFASGTPPFAVKNADLKPEVSYDDAHAAMASSMTMFLVGHMGGDASPSIKSQMAGALKQAVTETGKLVAPIIAALELEGFKHFKPACNSDNQLPASCPAYPRYPGGHTSDKQEKDCTCGTPWSVVAQQVMSGLDGDSSVTVEVTDAIHSVSDVLPVHLPKIWENSSTRVNVTTVTEPIYSTLDSFDTGYYEASASELRVKLKSRQTMIEATGKANVNFTATDVVTNNCKEINQKALDWALGNAGAVALARYKKIGVPMVMGDDLGPYNAGPLWIYNSMKYEMAKDKSKYTVQAPMMHTPDNYGISQAAGFHYCKVLSPARALEWIMIDSLRTKGGLSSR